MPGVEHASTPPAMRIDPRKAQVLAQRFVTRTLHKTLFAPALAVCTLWSGAQAWLAPAPIGSPSHASAWEWPRQWDGAPLRPLALTAVELRFARQFPGTLARLTDGDQVLVLRHVTQPTRMLHPAADCYRAAGYRITDTRLQDDAQGRRWRCFTATQADGTPLQVCERITDARGLAFTDTSAWYWAALRGTSAGPWQAVTTARALPVTLRHAAAGTVSTTSLP